MESLSRLPVSECLPGLYSQDVLSIITDGMVPVLYWVNEVELLELGPVR